MRTLSTLMAALVGLFVLGRFKRQRDKPILIPGFDFAGTSQARYQMGGDYHDIFVPPGKGSMAVAVGDVAGHDAVSARLMGVASRLLRARAAIPGGLAALMEGVNRELAPMQAGRFMTLFLAVMVRETRSIHWVSAGHAPVIAYDPVTDRFGEVPGRDIPLGIDPDWHYHELNHTGWSTGALLVVGTDGIWEARNPAGEMYGKKRLLRVVRETLRLDAASIVHAVNADVAAFRQGRPPGDDTTLVVVKAV
ncbi:MAG: serine/threonine-protein phosphatase [Rhodospirillaceae bacterium]|nr:serine/threonine-protein phosphatase [Rhodospirillales bacterium]